MKPFTVVYRPSTPETKRLWTRPVDVYAVMGPERQIAGCKTRASAEHIASFANYGYALGRASGYAEALQEADREDERNYGA